MSIKKSLKELIPKDFTPNHAQNLINLLGSNPEKYQEVRFLANDALDDRTWCENNEFNYSDQTREDLFRVMYGYALQKKYI